MRRAPFLFIAPLILLLHAGSTPLGYLLIAGGPSVVPVFPEAGLDLVLVLFFGTRVWPVLLVAYVAGSVVRDVPWLASVGVAIAGLGRDFAAAWLFGQASRLKKALGAFEDLTAVTLAGLLAPASNAVVGTASLIFGARFPVEQWGSVAGRFWVADAVGILTVSPVLVLLARALSRPLAYREFPWKRYLLFLAAVAAISYPILFQPEASHLLFFVLPPILLGVVWLGPSAGVLTALVVESLAIWATHTGTGVFIGGTMNETIPLMNPAVFVAAISLTGMAVTAFRSTGNLKLPGMVLVAGWALGGWLYARTDDERVKADAVRFDRAVSSVEHQIRDRLEFYESVLRGAASHIAGAGPDLRSDWHNYIGRLGLFERYPGAFVTSVLKPVTQENFEPFLAEQRRTYPNFRVHRLSDRPDLVKDHFVIVAHEPGSSAAAIVGLDMASQKSTEVSLQQARDSGKAVLSSPYHLRFEGGPIGLALFSPVFRTGAPTGTVAERRAALEGWVDIAFPSQLFFESTLRDWMGQLTLDVFHDADTPENVIFISERERKEAIPFEKQTTLSLAGNQWILGWRRTSQFPSSSRTPTALVAGSAALVTLLLAGVMMNLQSAGWRATALNERIIESTHDGILVLDLDGRASFVSAGATKLLGAHADANNLSWQMLWNSQQAAVRGFACARSGQATSFEGYTHDSEGKTKAWEVSIGPILEPDHSIHSIVCVLRDITQRKHLESQLLQAQKLESLGQLTAGIAHEINTPIQYVGDNTRFLQEAFQDILRLADACEHYADHSAGENDNTPEALAKLSAIRDEINFDFLKNEAPKAIEQSLEGVSRVADIVRAMKEFSHPGQRRMAPTDLNRGIHNTALVSKNEWKYVADLVEDLDPALPQVLCIAGEINQVVLNLIVNASHAIEDVVKHTPGKKGTITLLTRRENDSVRIEVSDTGSGISESAQPHIFNLFYTTKDVGRGTGQGLAFAYASVVQRHRGTITFETRVGVGTKFIVRLPLAGVLEEAAA